MGGYFHPPPSAPLVPTSLAYGGNNGVNKQSQLLFDRISVGIPVGIIEDFRCCLQKLKNGIWIKTRHLNSDSSSDGIPVGKAVGFAWSLFKVTLASHTKDFYFFFSYFFNLKLFYQRSWLIKDFLRMYSEIFFHIVETATGHALGILICGCSLFYKRELWASKSAGAHSTKGFKISWCKRWCSKDLRVRAPAAPVLTHSLQPQRCMNLAINVIMPPG